MRVFQAFLNQTGYMCLPNLSFYHGDKSGDRSYYLAAAAYAYAFFFPQEPSAIPGRFDPRIRVAVDLYNRGIAEGLNFFQRDGGDITERGSPTALRRTDYPS